LTKGPRHLRTRARVQASRKAWATRKRMKKARAKSKQLHVLNLKDFMEALNARRHQDDKQLPNPFLDI